jgi:predicted MFS family arabinose efflux permease
MSIAAMEAIVVVLGPITAFTYSVLAERREEPVAHSFLSIVALVYGIGIFLGSQILAFSFLDLLWKAPWLGPFYGVPQLIFGAVAFWSASLFLLMMGGIVLIVCSCMGFIFAAQEFAQL